MIYIEGGEDYGTRNTSKWVLTFSMIRNKLDDEMQWLGPAAASRALQQLLLATIEWQAADHHLLGFYVLIKLSVVLALEPVCYPRMGCHSA